MKPKKIGDTATQSKQLNHSQELFDEIYNALVWTNEALRATEYALLEKGFKNSKLHEIIEHNEALLQKVENANV